MCGAAYQRASGAGRASPNRGWYDAGRIMGLKGCVAAAVVGATSLAACGGRPAQAAAAHLAARERVAMGSSLALTAWTADEPRALAAFDAVFAEFDRLDALMNVWRPGSDIVRLNAAAGDRPVPVSGDTIEALRAARQVSEWTNGKFDVTFGALSDLWKFDQDQDNRIPDPGEVRRRLPLIDYRNLVVDDSGRTAFLRRRGMRVHLGGIGKGYAVARAAAILRGRGVGDFMIQAGGDLYVGGLKNGAPWRLGIADPRAPEHGAFATIDLSNATLSTSGDYERFFFANGRRYHHIIDPATGEPSTAGCRSVSVVSGDPTMADGLSTGIFLLGPRDGMALAERLHVGVVMVTDRNEVLVSPELRSRVTLVAAPADAP